MTPSQEYLQTETVQNTVDRIFRSGKITRADQRVFMTALLAEGSLTEEEQIQVNKVFDSLRRGSLKVVD